MHIEKNWSMRYMYVTRIQVKWKYYMAAYQKIILSLLSAYFGIKLKDIPTEFHAKLKNCWSLDHIMNQKLFEIYCTGHGIQEKSFMQ